MLELIVVGALISVAASAFAFVLGYLVGRLERD